MDARASGRTDARPVRLALIGAGGRMGRAILAAAAARSDCELVGAVGRPGGSGLGTPLLPGLCLSGQPRAALAAAEVAIDVSHADAVAEHARIAAEEGTALVVGVTGLEANATRALEEAARRVPVMVEGNFSLAVQLVARLVETAVRRLAPGFDVEILDVHHAAKRDSPSGTARLLGEAAARGLGRPLAELEARSPREGPRPTASIGFASLRGGSAIGEHQVWLMGQGERLLFAHIAEDRQIFAKGALEAALWIAGRPSGWHRLSAMVDCDAAPSAGRSP